MSNKIRTSLLIYLLLADVAAFALAYFLHANIFKGFSIVGALSVVGAELYWRLISLHIVIQAVILFVAVRFTANVAIVAFVATAIAYCIACLVAFSSWSAILNLLTLPNKDSMGEGFALAISLLLSLVVIKFLQESG